MGAVLVNAAPLLILLAWLLWHRLPTNDEPGRWWDA